MCVFMQSPQAALPAFALILSIVAQWHSQLIQSLEKSALCHFMAVCFLTDLKIAR